MFQQLKQGHSRVHPGSDQVVCKTMDHDFDDEPVFTDSFENFKPPFIELEIEMPSPVFIIDLNPKGELLQQERDKQIIEVMQNVKSTIIRLRFLYEDKQYYQANKELTSFLEGCKENQLNYPEIQQDQQQILDENKTLFQQIQVDLKEIVQMRDWFQLQDGWLTESKKKDKQVRYQQLPGTNLIVVRIDTEVNIPIDIFLSLIYETELYPAWFPFCAQIKTLAQRKQPPIIFIKADKATKILRTLLGLPIISDREMYIKGWGVNNMDYEGKIYVMVRSIDEDQEQMKKYNVSIPNNPKIVRGFMHLFSFEITPITMDSHKVTVLSSFDIKLKLVPSYFPNLFARKFAAELFEKLVSNSKNFKGSKWEKKQQDSPEFYQWMHKNVKDFFEKREGQVIQLQQQ